MTREKITLNKRQDAILGFIANRREVSVGDIVAFLNESFGTTPKITVNRDLKKLIELGLVVSHGIGKATSYSVSDSYSALREIDVEEYFSKEFDEREAMESFNFEIFDVLGSVFTDREEERLNKLNNPYRERMKNLPADVIKKEFERLTIDLSWKSSRIEGNTYSLLETDQLLTDGKEAQGHSKEEAIMILNHKKALDYIRSDAGHFTKLSVKKIEGLHEVLIDGLGVSKNIRKSLVGITGTMYKPLDNHYQIAEALEKMCKLVNGLVNVFEKAVVAMLVIAYIQPFVDGNKRTSRMIGNALLLANSACPVSYRSIDEFEYKKAVLLFYEQNNLSYFKRLFMEQFEFAVKNYFQ